MSTRRMPPKRAGFFFEPLWTMVSRAAWQDQPFVAPEGLDPSSVAELRREHDEGAKGAPWLVWGSSAYPHEKALAVAGPDGVARQGGGIVCKVGKVGDNPAGPTAQAMAERISGCLNAMAGVADPAALVRVAREVVRLDGEWAETSAAIEDLRRMLAC